MTIDFHLFCKAICYEFNNLSLLEESLTHKSFSVEANKNHPHNERFEFLGDAILNFVVAEELIKKFPNSAEGVLSKKRASLVNMNKLSNIAKKYSLEKFMKFGPGEIKQGNHLNPRIQGSCIEAIIGAIYLDSNLEIVKKWILDQFDQKDFYLNENDDGFESDYKTRLQELAQKRKLGIPIYEVVLMSGPSHKPHFVVSVKMNNVEMARADGNSKKTAEQNAAKMTFMQIIETES
jgi:ribonuclease-3